MLSIMPPVLPILKLPGFIAPTVAGPMMVTPAPEALACCEACGLGTSVLALGQRGLLFLFAWWSHANPPPHASPGIDSVGDETW